MTEQPLVSTVPLVSIVIVTWNSEAHLPRSLSCIKRQTYRNLEIIIVDNGSRDRSLELVEALIPEAKIVRNTVNLGFAAANNQGIACSSGDFVLCLNSDVFMAEPFVEELVCAIRSSAKIGAVCGKLLRAAGSAPPIIDSAGLSLTPALRSRDRGTGEADTGQYEEPCPVLAACGAAALYRRSALESAAIRKEEYFDPIFFAYYEDTELGWRLQLLGWDCLYTPKAVAYHVRGGAVNQAFSFSGKSDTFKLHTLKNRYLTAIKNISYREAMLLLPFILVMEAAIWGYCLLHPRLGWRLLSAMRQYLPDALAARRVIQSRRAAGAKLLPLILWPFPLRAFTANRTWVTRGT